MAVATVLIVALAAGGYALVLNNTRFGKKQYYTRIAQPGVANGQALWAYTYAQSAFDEDGKERRLTFQVEKSLRLQAYLRVYVAGQDHVTAWEEVSEAAVPALARGQLQSPARPMTD